MAYDDQTKDELRDEVDARGLDVPATANKAELIEALHADDGAQAEEGHQPTPREAPPSIEEAQEAAPDDDRSFPKARLVESSGALLGQPSHVVAGALAEEEDDAEISVADAHEKVESFLNRELES